MNQKLKIRDVSLRDGQQSLFQARMTNAQIESLLLLYKNAGFYALEVWGGSVPDAQLRFLHENPWDRLRTIANELANRTQISVLSRGRNLLGYQPYPDSVIEEFYRLVVQAGGTNIRIFDALNDLDNMALGIRYIKKVGATADCALCYSVDPRFKTFTRIKAILHAKPLKYKVFTNEYYLKRARELENLGADIITIKDMAGLITPSRAGELVRLLKEHLRVPVDFHTHCTPGYGTASSLMAILNGADIIDTSMLSFSGSTSNPAFEIIQLFCDKLNIDTGVDREAASALNRRLTEIRSELSNYDDNKLNPKSFHLLSGKLDRTVDRLFDQAIHFASLDKEVELQEACGAIEAWFNLPKPDERLQNAEIPGKMYTDMLHQLKENKQEKLIPKVLSLIPMVRLSSGCPPLVMPSSQIIGNQTVMCAQDLEKGQPLYTTRSMQFVNLVKGGYGKTPSEIDPEFRYKITGVRDETPYDSRYYKKPENTVFEEYGDVKLADNAFDDLRLDLFPSFSTDFLKNQIEHHYLEQIHLVEQEKRRKFEESKREYELLSPEQKAERLQQGLYSYPWTSFDEKAAKGHS